MPVDIHGKQYNTVAERISAFRETDPTLTIETQLIFQDEERVIMKALIMDGERLISTGYAEEVRGASKINSTSALENAETSAVGRALAFFGLAGTEIASADEVAGAIKQQHEKEMWARWAEHTQAVTEHQASLDYIRENLSQKNWEAAREAWNELDHDVQKILWRAPTKGGWFTTKERDQMKHFSELMNGERDE